MEALHAQVMYFQDELDDKERELEEAKLQLDSLERETSDRVAPLEYVQKKIDNRSKIQQEAAACEEVEERKRKKRQKTVGRGTTAVLPRLRLPNHSIVLTAGDGSFGQEDGPKPGTISCRQQEELAGQCQALRKSRRRLESEHRQILEEIQDITVTTHRIEMDRRLTSTCTELWHAVPGVFGRVAKLCNPIHKRFRVALNVALSGHLDAVVTQTVHGAHMARSYLKDRMLAPLTFLPLDNGLLKSMVTDPRLHEALQGRTKLRPALSCISFESSLSRAFDFLLSDVVVADSLHDGREFVFGVVKELGLKCRVVTLSGEVISRDGNLAVKGAGAKPGVTHFDVNALEAACGRLEVLQTQLAQLDSAVAHAEAAKARHAVPTRRPT
ncbi:SMC1 [Symbiodinium sp. CCMP2592]|nr:SMC1 [Symbiodinium sp. CCMP2592]